MRVSQERDNMCTIQKLQIIKIHHVEIEFMWRSVRLGRQSFHRRPRRYLYTLGSSSPQIEALWGGEGVAVVQVHSFFLKWREVSPLPLQLSSRLHPFSRRPFGDFRVELMFSQGASGGIGKTFTRSLLEQTNWTVIGMSFAAQSQLKLRTINCPLRLHFFFIAYWLHFQERLETRRNLLSWWNWKKSIEIVSR